MAPEYVSRAKVRSFSPYLQELFQLQAWQIAFQCNFEDRDQRAKRHTLKNRFLYIKARNSLAIHIPKMLFFGIASEASIKLRFSKFTFFKIYIFQNSRFSKFTFFKIHIFQNSYFSKFTIFKVHIFYIHIYQNSYFSKFTFIRIHIYQIRIFQNSHFSKFTFFKIHTFQSSTYGCRSALASRLK